ncbi:Uncharacterised protein [Zhongshania aliphaticivorans]|uniref:Uncharacterized protein n=1 Tax=Zhongshania aliphaticivorans TaxID=1470434 RepID=A0A5S9PIP6_9GAMM|nr:hypothetical protein [Zhongshania aliphaticivorans]CAA0103652.1 Uncharacterised protein [Zhongshania aliphaticivorans]CAA0113366.1 Uncharacterised protein [Zhongshania aliphaticivorans]
MRFLIPSVFLFTLCAPLAHAACVLPTPPKNFPDGITADNETMEFAKRRVERYFDSSRRFLKCLDTMDKTAVGTGRDNEERRRRRIDDYNTSMQNVASVMSEYTESVRQFNNR